MPDDFSKSGIEEWVLALLPEDRVPTRLKKGDVVRVRAYIKHPTFRAIFPRNPVPTEFMRDHYSQKNRAMNLLKACLELSEEPEPPVTALVSRRPKSEDEAIAMGYVHVTVILETLSDHFPSHKALDGYLNRHKDSISVYKPSQNRKMVRAAELLVILHSERMSAEEGAKTSRRASANAMKNIGK